MSKLVQNGGTAKTTTVTSDGVFVKVSAVVGSRRGSSRQHARTTRPRSHEANPFSAVPTKDPFLTHEVAPQVLMRLATQGGKSRWQGGNRFHPAPTTQRFVMRSAHRHHRVIGDYLEDVLKRLADAMQEPSCGPGSGITSLSEPHGTRCSRCRLGRCRCCSGGGTSPGKHSGRLKGRRPSTRP